MLQRGRRLVEEAEIDCGDIEQRLGRLRSSWDTLREAAAGRLQRLRDASEAQQYYLDAGEAEAWISEQELYVISDEIPKVRGAGLGCQAGRKAARKSQGVGAGGRGVGERVNQVCESDGRGRLFGQPSSGCPPLQSTCCGRAPRLPTQICSNPAVLRLLGPVGSVLVHSCGRGQR